MKKTVLLAALILGIDPLIDPVHTEAAERDPTYCHSVGIADGGFILTIAPDLRSAVLADQTFAGPRNIRDLACELLPMRRHPDALNNYLVCRSENAQESPLIVRLFSGGIAGVHYASIRSPNQDGNVPAEVEVQYGRLTCSH